MFSFLCSLCFRIVSAALDVETFVGARFVVRLVSLPLQSLVSIFVLVFSVRVGPVLEVDWYPMSLLDLHMCVLDSVV